MSPLHLVDSHKINCCHCSYFPLSGGSQPGRLHDVVVYADPRRPPYSLRALAAALSAELPLCLRVHCHSSVKVSRKSSFLTLLLHTFQTHCALCNLFKVVDHKLKPEYKRNVNSLKKIQMIREN